MQECVKAQVISAIVELRDHGIWLLLVEATGRFGAIHCSVLSKTFPHNPKTSVLSAFSLVRAAVNLGGHVIV